MWERKISQEVGLEATTLERVRNSSLVEWSCADNVTGLKPRAEAADFRSAYTFVTYVTGCRDSGREW